MVCTCRPKPRASAAAVRMSACGLHKYLRMAFKKSCGSSQAQSSHRSRAASAVAASGSCCASHRIVASSTLLVLRPATELANYSSARIRRRSLAPCPLRKSHVSPIIRGHSSTINSIPLEVTYVQWYAAVIHLDWPHWLGGGGR